jgi:two-component system chemotaxis response regulator CheB
VILTGTLDDGAAGLWAIKSRGGVAMVQDPKEADYPSMPLNAIQNVDVDECLPLARIPEALTRLIAEPPGSAQESAMSKQLEIETKIALENDPLTAGVMSLGEPSTFTCPSCHGSLLELKTGKMVRYRCHTGHAFSIQSLLAELTESTEDVLWNTIRALDEKIMLLSHLMQHAREHNQTDTETVLTTLANDAERQISLLREAMQSSPGTIRPTLTDNAFSSK